MREKKGETTLVRLCPKHEATVPLPPSYRAATTFVKAAPPSLNGSSCHRGHAVKGAWDCCRCAATAAFQGQIRQLSGRILRGGSWSGRRRVAANSVELRRWGGEAAEMGRERCVASGGRHIGAASRRGRERRRPWGKGSGRDEEELCRRFCKG